MAEAKRKTKKKAGKKEEAAEAPPPEMPDIDAPAKKGAPNGSLRSPTLCRY